MQKVLIDDNERDENGNKYQLWIYYYERTDPEIGEYTNHEILQSGKDKILLEMQMGNEIAVPGSDLVRIKISPDDNYQIIEKFRLAPDQAYSLFKYWQEIDDKIRIEDRNEDWEAQERILELLKQNFPERLNVEVISQSLNMNLAQLTYAIACLVREHFIDIEYEEQTIVWLTPRGIREMTL